MNVLRFTALRGGMFSYQTPVWLNPERTTFLEPRYSRRGERDVVVGTRVHFGPDTTETLNAVLELVEEPEEVLALLAGHDYDRELKLDLTGEAARADLLP
jgi:hypothetical protein